MFSADFWKAVEAVERQMQETPAGRIYLTRPTEETAPPEASRALSINGESFTLTRKGSDGAP